MRRRAFLTGSVGGAVMLAGCGVGEEDDDSPDVEDEEIDAEPADVIVTVEDLDAGWRQVSQEDESATFLNPADDMSVDVFVNKHGSVEDARDDYEARLAIEHDEGFGVDELDIGNEAYLVLLDSVLAKVVYRAGDFVIEVQATAFTDAGDADVEAEAKRFAGKVEENIDEHQ